VVWDEHYKLFVDFENRLSSVTLPGTGGTITFKYDPFGPAHLQVIVHGNEHLRLRRDNLIEETNSAGGVVARYSQGVNVDEPLAMLRSGATSFYKYRRPRFRNVFEQHRRNTRQTYTFDSFGKQNCLHRLADQSVPVHRSRIRYGDGALLR